jgi:riboflavin synthase
MAKTQLATLKRYDRINMEPALRMGDPVGGHHVSGHVDGCAQVRKFAPMESTGAWELVLLLEESWLDWVVEHGSVAVRGTSLTIASVDRQARQLSIMLIPHTLAVTNLPNIKVGSLVEIEFDMQIKALVQTAKRILPQLVKYTQAMPAGQSHV